MRRNKKTHTRKGRKNKCRKAVGGRKHGGESEEKHTQEGKEEARLRRSRGRQRKEKRKD